MADSTATTDTQDTDATPADAPNTGDATGTNGGNDGRTFTQADVNRIFSVRLAKEKEKLASEIEADLRQKIEAEHQRKQQEEAEEFKPLYETAQKELAELKPQVEKAQRYEAALRTHLDREREGLPEHITTLLDRMDVAEQLEYIAANRDSLRPQQPRPGVPDTPTANGHLTDSEAIEAEIQRQRRTGRYAL